MAKNDTKQESVVKKKKKAVDRVEKYRRIRMVCEWMIDGNETEDIISQIQTMWGLSSRQPYTYIKWALEWFEKIVLKDIEQRRGVHLAQLHKMYKQVLADKQLKAKERYSLGLAILQDMGKIKGLYKHEISIESNHTTTEKLEITLDLGETSEQQEGETETIIPLQTSVDNELPESHSE